MPSLARTFAALLAVLTACSSDVERASCASDAQCPLASRCSAGVCTAHAPPVATIRLPPQVEAFALVQLDGSESAGPDGDGISVHAWTVRAISAQCEPPAIAGTHAIAWVRFGCPGRYAVELVVRDALGVESEGATRELDVVPATASAVIAAGADVATDHACNGEPLVCRPTAPIRLSSSSAIPGVTVRWSVEPPPGRSLEATRRVSFLPGPEVPSPEVFIETDGSAISGDWIFRAEARDAFGAVGAAHTRVSIGNRPPVVAADPAPPAPHAYDAARWLFTSSGELPFAAYDPDGDPVELAAIWRHVGDGGSRFAGALLPDRATFSIEVVRAAPEDALLLRGGAGLERTIEIVARDPNGAEGWARRPILVGNRPPAPLGAPGSVRVPHLFDRTRSRYVAVASLGEWADPDGDPLTASGGAAPCEAVSLLGGAVQAECAAAYEGSPAVERIAGWHPVTVRVSDPWESGPAAVHTVEILNSPPAVVVIATSPPSVSCSRAFFTLCGPPLGGGINLSASQFQALPGVSDPDGDPVAVTPLTPLGGTASPQLAVSADGTSVPFHFDLPALRAVCPVQLPPAGFRGSDGAATVEVSALPALSGC